MNLRSSYSLGLLLALALSACGLDSGGGGGSSGRSGAGGLAGTAGGIGGNAGGSAGVGIGGAGGSPCGAEACDGIDNDCDGVIDEGEASNSCRGRLPNAEAACVQGLCLLTTCLPGFASCDGQPANGCETLLSMRCGQCLGCP